MQREYKSGAAKRKQARKEKEAAVAKSKKLDDYFKPQAESSNSSEQSSEEEELENVEAAMATDAGEGGGEPVHGPEGGDVADNFVALGLDIGLWPIKISDAQVCDVIKRGTPEQVTIDFPFNDSAIRRRFTSVHYLRKLSNGESVARTWLVYSVGTDKIFCFCCRLFGNENVPLRLGTNVWEGLSKKLHEHEIGKSHVECMEKWGNLQVNLTHGATIDDRNLQIFFKERDFWRDVLKRLIDFIIFLGGRNLAFRGKIEHIGSNSNGNFLGLFELMAKYDPVLQELLHRIVSKSTADHYLSPQIQNELIGLVADKVESENLVALKSAKYYGTILDCTPDVSHTEQMSLVFRFVDCIPKTGITIRECFFGFLEATDTTGEGLLAAFMNKLEQLEINIADMRAQSYDNGANMKGANKGVQARILQLNDKAMYVPCSAHSLNLVVCDAAKSSNEAVNFFGILNRVYVLFSSSTARWDILLHHMPITVKPLSDTRWESHIDAVKPFRYNLGELRDALDALEEHAMNKKDGVTATEARELSNRITSWPFIISIIVWHTILHEVNKTSKLLQSPQVSLAVLSNEINATKQFLNDNRSNGFALAITEAQKIAEQLDVMMEFPAMRMRKKKRQFDYEASDEGGMLSAEETFRTQFFLKLVDTALGSITNRFEKLSDWFKLFGFLYSAEHMKVLIEEGNLTTHCQDYGMKLNDVEVPELEMEIRRFAHVIDEDDSLVYATDFLNYIYKTNLVELYPNFSIALRVLLTAPVTVASAERSFSRLKIIKNVLRSTMGQERLSALAIISIEIEQAKKVDYDEVITCFAKNKARRKQL